MSKNENGFKTILIDAPKGLFDAPEGEVVSIERRRRVPVWRVDEMRKAKNAAELYEGLAYLVPKWHNVRDIDSGDLLPHPIDDPMVFDKIDYYEQLPWISDQVIINPAKSGKVSRGGRGRT